MAGAGLPKIKETSRTVPHSPTLSLAHRARLDEGSDYTCRWLKIFKVSRVRE